MITLILLCIINTEAHLAAKRLTLTEVKRAPKHFLSYVTFHQSGRDFSWVCEFSCPWVTYMFQISIRHLGRKTHTLKKNPRS